MSVLKENVNKLAHYQLSHDGKYECKICEKKLTTKQRVLTHLSSKKHRFSELFSDFRTNSEFAQSSVLYFDKSTEKAY